MNSTKLCLILFLIIPWIFDNIKNLLILVNHENNISLFSIIVQVIFIIISVAILIFVIKIKNATFSNSIFLNKLNLFIIAIISLFIILHFVDWLWIDKNMFAYPTVILKLNILDDNIILMQRFVDIVALIIFIILFKKHYLHLKKILLKQDK